jgi:NitT/TauT family transport system ATP-binding protein
MTTHVETATAAPAAAGAWASLAFQGVGKVFVDTRGRQYVAARDIDVSIARGDFYCLLGPSGCGKSTLLGMVAGFEPPSSGRIVFVGDERGGERITPVVAAGVDRSMIFQDAAEALFPWLDVEENVLFGPRLRNARHRGYKRNAAHYLKMVGLHDHAHKFPFELSGGMKQRVQIARALIMEPDILLMDEPFAALDAITKRSLQVEVSRIWQETGKTIMYVTHDIVEALLLGTRVAVMTAGPGATIKRELVVDLPRPRRTTDSAFVELTKVLEDLLHEEVHGAGRER